MGMDVFERNKFPKPLPLIGRSGKIFDPTVKAYA